MRQTGLPILAQMYFWMYAVKYKSEIVAYIESISVLCCYKSLKTLSYTDM